MLENQQLIIDKFQEHLCRLYEEFCLRHQIERSTHSLLTFLIDCELIPKVTIKRFTIQQEYEEMNQKEQRGKSKLVVSLSDKFNIPERTIWSILKKRNKEV